MQPITAIPIASLPASDDPPGARSRHPSLPECDERRDDVRQCFSAEIRDSHRRVKLLLFVSNPAGEKPRVPGAENVPGVSGDETHPRRWNTGDVRGVDIHLRAGLPVPHFVDRHDAFDSILETGLLEQMLRRLRTAVREGGDSNPAVP